MRCPDSSSFILLSGFYIDGLKVVAWHEEPNLTVQSYLFEREKQVFFFYKLWKSFFYQA